MANADAPFGLRPVRYKNGAPWNGQATKYWVPATDGTALYLGDPVDIAGSAGATGMHATVTRATLADGNYTIGPVVGVEATTDESLVYRAASTGRYIWVADDPYLIFHIQLDSATNLVITDIGSNAIGVDTHSGSTVTGYSGMELDESSAAANASLMFVIIGGANVADNDPLTQHGIVEVMISMHRWKSTGDGDGILGV